MAITASSITTSNTLEQLRTQFNNLVTDVSGLESGTLAYGALSATTTNTTTLTSKKMVRLLLRVQPLMDLRQP